MEKGDGRERSTGNKHQRRAILRVYPPSQSALWKFVLIERHVAAHLVDHGGRWWGRWGVERQQSAEGRATGGRRLLSRKSGGIVNAIAEVAVGDVNAAVNVERAGSDVGGEVVRGRSEEVGS